MIIDCSMWLLTVFVSVVGEKELGNNTLNVRTRDNRVHGEHSIDHVVSRFNHFIEAKSLDAEETF